MTRLWIGLGVTLLFACDKTPLAFVCDSNAQCSLAGVLGTCEPSRFCSFPDTSCAGSGQRYGQFAGADLGLSCVGWSFAFDAGVDAQPRVPVVIADLAATSARDLGIPADDLAAALYDMRSAPRDLETAVGPDLALPCGKLTQSCCANNKCNALLTCLLGKCT
jgi:hypothetical protein